MAKIASELDNTVQMNASKMTSNFVLCLISRLDIAVKTVVVALRTFRAML